MEDDNITNGMSLSGGGDDGEVDEQTRMMLLSFPGTLADGTAAELFPDFAVLPSCETPSPRASALSQHW
jgi:hypothetical protein